MTDLICVQFRQRTPAQSLIVGVDNPDALEPFYAARNAL